MLSEVAPERRDQLVARGIDYGKSRSICNVHWLSDVQASQIIGSAAVAQLHTDPVFRADLRAAALEVKALREQGRKPDDTYCSLEIKALVITPTSDPGESLVGPSESSKVNSTVCLPNK